MRRTKPEAAATQVVARGDTLYRIARRHRVALRALIERNRLRPPYWLELGQRLIIPRPGSHVVSKGDTLYSISRRYGVDVRALVQTNRLRRPYAIAIGQKLALPGSAPLASATPAREIRKLRRVAPVAISRTLTQYRRCILVLSPGQDLPRGSVRLRRKPARPSFGRFAGGSSWATDREKAGGTMMASTSLRAAVARFAPPKAASWSMPGTNCADSAIFC